MPYKSHPLLISALIATASTANAIDVPTSGGQVVPNPPDPGYINGTNLDRQMFDAMQAVCAVGYQLYMDDACNSTDPHVNFGTGLLIAPNLVVTDGHVISSPNWSITLTNQQQPSGPGCSQGTGLVVRFRKRVDNGVTSYGTKAGGVSSFYQVPVKRVIWPDYTHTPSGFVRPCPDTVILVLADGPTETGTYADGWITHIDPVPLSASPAITRIGQSFGQLSYGAGWGQDIDASVADHPGTEGVLRYATSDQEYTITGSPCDNNVSFSGDGPNDFVINGHSDSGRPFFFLNQRDEVVAEHYNGLTFRLRSTYDNPSMSTTDTPPHTPEPEWFPITSFAFSEFDVSGTSFATSSAYQNKDLLHTVDDVMTARWQVLNGNLNFDFVAPMGITNEDDWLYFINAMKTTPNAYNAFSMFPLPPGDTDLNGDGRLNQLDYDLILAADGTNNSAMDFNGYSLGGASVDPHDVGLIADMLNNGFGHGIFGDLDGDDDFDSDDQALLDAMLISTPDLYTYGYSIENDPEYLVELDANLDGMLDGNDAYAFRPLDVNTTGGAITSSIRTSDGRIDRWDILKFLHRISVSSSIGSSVSWADLDQDTLLGLGDFEELANQYWAYRQSSSPTAVFLDLGLDANGDMVWNYQDIQHIRSLVGQPYDPNWDLDANGSITTNDASAAFWSLFDSTSSSVGQLPVVLYNHGVLGDANYSDSPTCDCSQNIAMGPNNCFDGSVCPITPPLTQEADCVDLNLLAASLGTYFGGQQFPSQSYRMDMDADLDGDNDNDDWLAIFVMLEPADRFNPDGVLDNADQAAFFAALQAHDPISDIFPAGGDGSYDTNDFNQFSVWWDNATGLCN